MNTAIALSVTLLYFLLKVIE